MLRRFFQVPETEFTNQFDLNKFAVTWKVYWFLLFILIFLSTSQFINGAPDFMITLIGVVHAIAMLVILKKTRKFFVVALISGFVGLLINQLNIFFVMNGERFIDLLWILVVSFYIFYAVGVRWGIVSLVVNFAGLVIYIFVMPTEKIVEAIANRNVITQIDILVNCIVTVSVICYLLAKIMQATKHAERQYIEANEELTKQNELINEQHKEKTVLLKEIHHRVKNNLQIISSLLKLQTGDTDNPETQVQLHDAMSRIRSMALIHEKMYRTSDLARINLQDYLNTLMEEIVNSYAKEIRVDAEIESNIDHLSIDHLVPIALIFNELTTNSMKHGFADKTDGKINISIHRDDAGNATIEYRDSGTWVKPKKTNGFGTMIIETLTEQLDGKFSCDTSDGTMYHFEFDGLGKV